MSGIMTVIHYHSSGISYANKRPYSTEVELVRDLVAHGDVREGK